MEALMICPFTPVPRSTSLARPMINTTSGTSDQSLLKNSTRLLMFNNTVRNMKSPAIKRVIVLFW